MTLEEQNEFLKFKQLLEADFTLSAIENFWIILEIEKADNAWIMNRLKKQLGEMNKKHAGWIFANWEKVKFE